MKLRFALAAAILWPAAASAQVPEAFRARALSAPAVIRGMEIADEDPRIQLRLAGTNDRQGNWNRMQLAYELGDHGIVRLRHERTTTSAGIARETTVGWTVPLSGGWRTTLRAGTIREGLSRERVLEVFLALSF